MKYITIYSILIAIIMGLLTTSLLLQHERDTLANQYETQQVCDKMLRTNTADDRTTCQTLEAKYKLEFICDHNFNNCWTEVK